MFGPCKGKWFHKWSNWKDDSTTGLQDRICNNCKENQKRYPKVKG